MENKCKMSIKWLSLLEQVINCGTLANIENGRLEIRGTTVGSIARYSCLFGFLLAGNPVRTCLNDGTWSGNAPFCRRMFSLLVLS